MGSVIFVAGVYGVGKSTLCGQLSQKCHVNFYSAGDLISDVNGEKYGANKTVKDKVENQDILVRRILEKIEHEEKILLAGHFCILGSEGQVEILPIDTYGRLHISSIVLLEAEADIIVKNLKKRDGKDYSMKQIEKFIGKERECATSVSKLLNIPLHVHKMDFSSNDLESACLILEEVYGENFIGY